MSTGFLRRMGSASAAGYAVPLCLFLFAALLYANTARSNFVLDDRSLVERNPLIRNLRQVPALFTVDYWHPKTVSGLYRPVVSTSYALNFAAGGFQPAGYHRVKIALHG